MMCVLCVLLDVLFYYYYFWKADKKHVTGLELLWADSKPMKISQPGKKTKTLKLGLAFNADIPKNRHRVTKLNKILL